MKETSHEGKTAACFLTSSKLLPAQQICPSLFPQNRSLLAAALPDGSSLWVDTVAYKTRPEGCRTPAPTEERLAPSPQLAGEPCLQRGEPSLRRANWPMHGVHQLFPSATAWSPRVTALLCPQGSVCRRRGQQPLRRREGPACPGTATLLPGPGLSFLRQAPGTPPGAGSFADEARGIAEPGLLRRRRPVPQRGRSSPPGPERALQRGAALRRRAPWATLHRRHGRCPPPPQKLGGKRPWPA